MGTRTYVIAEVGVNHDGDINKALELVEELAVSGADAVKIQTFTATRLVHPRAAKAAYQLKATPDSESQLDMLMRLELSRDEHYIIKEAAQSHGLDFLSTPYDVESLNFLVRDLGIRQIKIASADITNLPLLLAAGRSHCHVLLSTGMSTVQEIRMALTVLGFGALNASGNPDIRRAPDDFDRRTRDYLRASVVLLQCTSEYPARLDDANLKAITTMREQFGVSTGFSDHTLGSTAAVMSVALGSVVYERHVTLDRSASGPDHSTSLEPAEFTELVRMIRECEIALGSGVKTPSAGERMNRFAMRKSLMAARDISRGQVIGEKDIAIMRPETGDVPGHYWDWLGRTASRDFSCGDPLMEGR